MSFRVLIIDDSMLVRQIVRDVLRRIPDVEVAGEARNGQVGLELMKQLEPDLMILDNEMNQQRSVSIEIQACWQQGRIYSLSVRTFGCAKESVLPHLIL